MMFQKIKQFLFEFDFVWSTPVAFILFYLFAEVGTSVFGDGFAFYPPSFFHAGIYASLIVVFFAGVVQMGIFFHFPEMYQYYLKDFENLKPEWVKPLVFLLVYFFFFLSLVAVWRTLV